MNEGFEKLKEIGAQKIYEKTHIARKNVEYILSKSYDKIPKIQFRGFISILEREYHLDLSGILKEYESQSAPEVDPLEPVIEKKEIKINPKALLSIAIVIVVFIGYILISDLLKDKSSDNMELNNSQIEAAQMQIEQNQSDMYATDTNVSSEQNVTQPVEEVNSTVATKFDITTNQPLWIGYIDMSDLKKKQITVQHNFSLDPSKNYLLILGHGMIKIDLGIDVKQYHDVKQKYFKFENGELSELTRTEFRALNKGNLW